MTEDWPEDRPGVPPQHAADFQPGVESAEPVPAEDPNWPWVLVPGVIVGAVGLGVTASAGGVFGFVLLALGAMMIQAGLIGAAVGRR